MPDGQLKYELEQLAASKYTLAIDVLRDPDDRKIKFIDVDIYEGSRRLEHKYFEVVEEAVQYLTEVYSE